tara:strand:+ start:239 stop:736 length:498 start_codon:yes stop_codon:yes gene_type:complete
MDYMRPTTSKVRLAIISMLSEKIIANSKILDIFAGIGSVSKEFDKFSPKKIVMIESNIKNIKLLKKDFKKEHHKVIRGDVFNCIPKLDEKFNIIFADPPYEQQKFFNLAEMIIKSDIFEKNGILIYEHYKNYELPEEFQCLKKVRDKKYGDSRISIYKNEGVISD